MKLYPTLSTIIESYELCRVTPKYTATLFHTKDVYWRNLSHLFIEWYTNQMWFDDQYYLFNRRMQLYYENYCVAVRPMWVYAVYGILVDSIVYYTVATCNIVW